MATHPHGPSSSALRHRAGPRGSRTRPEVESDVEYVVTWRERPTGSATEYEAAQKRVLEVLTVWEMPESLTSHQWRDALPST